MTEERNRILQLLREGKITVQEAEELLDALGPGREGAAPAERQRLGERGRSRRLVVRITDLQSGKVKTNVRLPPTAWGLLSKLTRTRLGRHLSGHALHDIQRAAREGYGGHIVDITNDEKGERVEIFFE